ncbi:hypothetical protein YH66_09820 [[Brevibacterium] flavum]|uniref:IrrE N-terminal-like domain-containing protein n=1 Tax=[Brevibacterium] flavum TaxID=92706 RepID=A0A0F6SRE6_9CORY|nr:MULTISPECIES: ImmA/IrrE family metallo-endopeptidase [Corynebacterium]AKF27824.1 hypothetical protein YH66_09820 [[Brevibacterium] flavum]ANE08658.1 hypothetical protein A3654_09880 [Corynebacterium glutamicum]AST21071.1 ImmA/IrrE family metallo-endopeptidase [Corynebacterium glutamicum ATCC 14067]KEI23581.1 hypothetical protein KIQ_013745 [Corynebacterium glutamicum ATCC 14067]KIH73326.1 hypothetical protein SD36_09850 [Corynebacterium glutamicum]
MDLDKIAELFGVRVAETKDLHPDHHGMYIHHRRLILLRAGLDGWNYRSIFAHELAHAFYRDEVHGDTRAEKRANQWAAQLLISKDEYRAAELLHGPHPGAIAHELGVTPDVVKTWCDIFMRATIR